jgi:2-oxoglutarate ferredoxin oxidoreductase subunit beta
VNLKILLFNNRIYGLTKGQYSPTSEPGKVTKSTPMGSIDQPFNPVSLALGAEASFVARTVDSDRKHLTEVLRAAAAHRGSALVEIYQNCPIFNDGAFDAIKGAKDSDAANAIIPLRHGEPIRFGVPDENGVGGKGVIRDRHTGGVRVVDVVSTGSTTQDGSATQDGPTTQDGSTIGYTEADLLVHDAHAEDPTTAFALSRLTDGGYLHQAPVGIFRQVDRPTYDDQARLQVATASEGTEDRSLALAGLLSGGDTWTVV